MIHRQLGPDLTVHTHACGEGGIFVNAFVLETRASLVAVDATLTESESKAFAAEVGALGKPLEAVLITHAHPDHVAGITNLAAGRRPRIIATEACRDLMRALEEPKRKQWTPVFGDEWVQRWTHPDTVARSGDRFTFDGLTVSVLDLGAGGDADSNAVWLVEGPVATAFLGDLVFNGPHSYIADGHLLAWLANLTRLEELCRSMEVVFPGHGPADRPGRLFAAQREYLLAFAAHVKELAEGRPSLTDAAKAELERRMKARAPEAGLGFLIGMSADPVARELAGSTT